MMKTYILFLFLILTSVMVSAQQLPVLSQYMYNRMYYNPAYAGSNEQTSASLLHRSQWLGVKGSPNTQLFSIDAPVGKNVGLGLNLANDRSGVTSQTDVLGSFSYNLGGSGLSFGLRAGISYYSARLTNVFIIEQGDPVFSDNVKSAILPKFGAGAYYSNDQFYLGVSVPDLIVYDQSGIFDSPDRKTANIRSNYIAFGGIKTNISPAIQFEPSLLIKHHYAYPLLIHLNGTFHLNEWLSAGAGYRVNNAFTGIIQLKLIDKLKMGYSFDVYQPNVRLGYLNSHEIMLSYNLGLD
ncbi:MAG: type IX secretion system membrane protein PorP/SprF [Cytophagaceae bacterium]